MVIWTYQLDLSSIRSWKHSFLCCILSHVCECEISHPIVHISWNYLQGFLNLDWCLIHLYLTVLCMTPQVHAILLQIQELCTGIHLQTCRPRQGMPHPTGGITDCLLLVSLLPTWGSMLLWKVLDLVNTVYTHWVLKAIIWALYVGEAHVVGVIFSSLTL